MNWSHLGAANYIYPEEVPREISADVIVVRLSQLDLFAGGLQKLKTKNSLSSVILIMDADELPTSFTNLLNLHILSEYLYNPSPAEIESAVVHRSEYIQTQKQNLHLKYLVEEQTEQLLKMQKELEDRVEKRSRHLLDTRAKLVQTNLRIESFRKALVATYKASSLQELEQFLNSSLAEMLKTSWIKIVFEEDGLFEKDITKQLDFSYLKIPLYASSQVSAEQEKIGSIFFMKPSHLKFTKEEKDLLDRVSETVSLSIARLQRLDEAEALKMQWESTFNAISDPLILVNEAYEVLQSNTAFAQQSKSSSKSAKCFEQLFARQSPCEGCVLGKKILVQDSQFRNYEVSSQKLSFESSKSPVYANFYRDITDQLQLQQELMESARGAELGIISSSIAHELNNPLGGMLTFTQLLRMDLPPQHPFYQDLIDIEAGIHRCKDIVQNLLVLARKPIENSEENISVASCLKEALQVLELQTKSFGIRINPPDPQLDFSLRGKKHYLLQSLTSLLQESINSINQKKYSYPQHKGRIDIFIYKSGSKLHLEIKDNGIFADDVNVISPKISTRAKSVAQRLINELGGELHLKGFTDPFTRALLIFENP